MTKKLREKERAAEASKAMKAPVSQEKPAAFTKVQQSQPTSGNGGAKAKISHEMIAARAYAIFKSGKGGSADENWARAEKELKAEKGLL